MNRRNFVGFLLSLPFVSYFVGKAESKTPSKDEGYYFENPKNLTVLEFVNDETAQLTPECIEKLMAEPLYGECEHVNFRAWLCYCDGIVQNDGYFYWGELNGIIGIGKKNDGILFLPSSKAAHKVKVGRSSCYFDEDAIPDIEGNV